MTRAEKIADLEVCIPRLRSIAFSLLEAWEVDDVVQNAVRDALEGIDSFGGRSSVYTWAVKILVRRVADYTRSEARRRRLCPTYDVVKAWGPFMRDAPNWEQGDGVHMGYPFLDWEDTVGDGGHAEDIITDRLYIDAIFSRLEEEHVEVLSLRFLEGYSLGAIAEIVGITYEAARSRVRRSLEYALRAAEWMEGMRKCRCSTFVAGK